MSISAEPLHIEFDGMDRKTWDDLIIQFSDASLFQTWSFGSLYAGKSSLSHILVKSQKEVLCCCQVVLRRFLHSKIGLADIKWGPLCLNKSVPLNPEALVLLIRGIKMEYGHRRGYLLRIWSHARGEIGELLQHSLAAAGFKSNQKERPYRTFLIDLSPPLDQIRNNLLQKWRNGLNKAERSGIQVIQGSGDDLFKTAIQLARQMSERKELGSIIKYFEHYRSVQQDLPEKYKMIVMVGLADGEPAVTAICSAIGDTGIYLFGASGEKGLKNNGSYLLQWQMIRWMKERGIAWYDLGAFNMQRNPGVYHFKKGLAGKAGREETFIEHLGSFTVWSKLAEEILHISSFFR